MDTKNVVNSEVIKEICRREKISLYVWIGVVIYQVIVGLIFNYEILIIGAINIVACITSYKFTEKIKVEPIGVFKHYKDSLISSIIFIIVNIWLGGLIGVIGAIYDITIRQYAMKHEAELLELESQFTNTNEEA